MTFSVGQKVVVADASVAVRMLLGHREWVQAWQGWVGDGAMVIAPTHFRHEVANALLRSARVGEAATLAALELLAGIGIEFADRGAAGISASVRLAQLHHLSVYDAAYLDLAIDVDGELATLDRDLAAAAQAEEVAVVSAPD